MVETKQNDPTEVVPKTEESEGAQQAFDEDFVPIQESRAPVPDDYGKQEDADDHRGNTETIIESHIANGEWFVQNDLFLYPDDVLVLNDVVLADVPATAINMQQTTDVFIAETLRSEAPIVAPLGRRNIHLQISLVFNTSNEGHVIKLRRLLAQLQFNPFVFIYSNKIRKDLGLGVYLPGESDGSDEVTTMFILESGTLRNINGMTDSLALDLSLHYFNYKPFTKHCWFKTTFPGLETDEYDDISPVVADEAPLDLDELQGYSSQSYGVEAESTRILSQLSAGLDYIDPKRHEKDRPVAFPGSSKVYQYYVKNLLENVELPKFAHSDYFGLELARYELIQPSDKASRQGNNFQDYYKSWKLPARKPRYKAGKDRYKQLIGKASRLISAKAGGAAEEGAARGENGKSEEIGIEIDLSTVYGRGYFGDWKQVRIDIGAGKGKWTGKQVMEAGTHLSAPLGGPKGDGFRTYKVGTKCNILAFETLYRAGFATPTVGGRGAGNGLPKHTDKKRVGYSWPSPSAIVKGAKAGSLNWGKVVNGLGKQPLNKLIDTGGAILIVWDGKSSTEMKVPAGQDSGEGKKKPKRPGRHVGILTRVRQVQYQDDDPTKIKKFKAMYMDQNQPIAHAINWNEGNLRLETAYMIAVYIAKPEEKQKRAAAEQAVRAANMTEEEKALEKKAAEDAAKLEKERKEAAEKRLKDKSTKTQSSRDKWIQKTEEKYNLTYYRKDVNVRNVFIRYLSRFVSGKLSSPVTDNLSNIVPIGLSITFGHRIVPQRLIGQETPTWQFLGAGNKSGAFVLSYSGPEGRASAAELKKLIEYAQENARSFSSVIREAGSLRVSSINSLTGEENYILRLLNINNIVVTSIEENNVPDSADQYQMVIEFVNQDFREEKLAKNFVTTTEFKKQIIKRLLSWIVRRIDKNIGEVGLSIHIKGASQWVNPSANKHDEYITYHKFKDPNFPPWLADILGDVHFACVEADRDSAGAYADYREYGTTVIYGNDEHSDAAYRKVWYAGLAFFSGTSKEEKDKEISAILSDRNGIVFDRWLGRMSIYADRVQRHMSDEVAFKKYFKGFNDITSHLIEDLGSCYQDMKLPLVPLSGVDKKLALTLPPEFYFYEDALEDAASVGLKGSSLTEKFAEKHLQNNIQSIQHYFREHHVGGAYVSENIDRVIANRQGWNEKFGGEYGFDSEALGFKEGVKTWEPSMYRNDSLTSAGGIQWKNTIAKWANRGIGENLEDAQAVDDDKIRSKFMENLIQTVPMLNSGRKWVSAESILGAKEDEEFFISSPNDKVVEMIYGKNASALTFGPNQRFVPADSVLDGVVPGAASHYKKEEKKKEEAAKDPKKKAEKVSNNTYKTKDGALVTADFTEKEEISFLDKAKKFGTEVAGSVSDFFTQGEILNLLTDKERSLYRHSGATVEGDWRNASLSPDLKAVYLLYVLKKIDKRVVVALLKKELDEIVALRKDNLKKRSVTGRATTEEELAKRQLEAVKDVQAQKEAKERQDRVQGTLNAQTHGVVNKKKLDTNVKRGAREAIASTLGTLSDDLSMRRAFPTFKIFFIEDDSEESEKIDGRVVRAFDDFYSSSAIQEIRVTRSRKIAADFAVIRMTNVGGRLFRRRFGTKDPKFTNTTLDGIAETEDREEAVGFYSDTEKENPFEKIVLQDGVKVQIRMGYAAAPNDLETVFLGQIVEISPSEDQRIIQLVCQGYGAELEAVEHGPTGDGPTYLSAQGALAGALLSPEIVNFGRQSRFNSFNIAEIRTRFTGGTGDGPLDGFLEPWKVFSWAAQSSAREMLTQQRFLNDPQDDNIYAPPPPTYADSWERYSDNACVYRPMRQTVWDIFKEHELRHPGYISLAVPYGHSSRMTMFFGPKFQNYWSKPVTAAELALAEDAEKEILQLRGISFDAMFKDEKYKKRLVALGETSPGLAKAILRDMTHRNNPKGTAFEIGKLFGRYRPFRSYHYLTSGSHILKNNIRTSRDGVFNQIELRYFADEEQIHEIGNLADMAAARRELAENRDGILTTKLDENIPLEHIRSYTTQYLSCITTYMAKRYSQGLFARFMRDAYKGELIILGSEKIRPYDVCHIHDTFTNMTGPIEVEAVTHIFNRESGFISIITPDLCVDINEFWSASVMDISSALLSQVSGLDIFMGGVGQVGAGALLGAGPWALLGLPLAAAAWFGTVKYLQCNQDGAPVLSTPLMLGGKPLMTVNIGPRTSGVFAGLFGQWRQLRDDTKAAYGRGDVGESIAYSVTKLNMSIIEWVAGTN